LSCPTTDATSQSPIYPTTHFTLPCPLLAFRNYFITKPRGTVLQTVNNGDIGVVLTFANPQGETVMTLQFTHEAWHLALSYLLMMTCEGIWSYLCESIKTGGGEELFLVVPGGESEISALLIGITMKTSDVVFEGLLMESQSEQNLSRH
jgi:hypothetical protein